MGILKDFFSNDPSVSGFEIVSIKAQCVEFKICFNDSEHLGTFTPVVHDAYTISFRPHTKPEYIRLISSECYGKLVYAAHELTPYAKRLDLLEKESTTLANLQFKNGLRGEDTAQVIADRTRNASDVKFVQKAIKDALIELNK